MLFNADEAHTIVLNTAQALLLRLQYVTAALLGIALHWILYSKLVNNTRTYQMQVTLLLQVVPFRCCALT